MNIGITGGQGFIGYHTYYNLKFTTDWNIIKLDRDFANDKRIKTCDWIIHLAGVNRGSDKELYDINIDLANKLINSINKNCNIIFSSSTYKHGKYGEAKYECEGIFEKWSLATNNEFHRHRIPNVFGPFCKPNYNSFVATFCDDVVSNRTPKILRDSEVSLVYVQDVVEQFKLCIRGKSFFYKTNIVKVSDVAKKLESYKKMYFEKNKIPNLNDNFDRNLFNTFLSYLSDEQRLLSTKLYNDERGSLVELLRNESSESQMFFSTTNPSYVRGQHFHMHKFERFCVIKGCAKISMRKIGSEKIIEYEVSGDDIKLFDTPVMFTHNIKNVGDGEMVAVFWVSELLDKSNNDTYWENV